MSDVALHCFTIEYGPERTVLGTVTLRCTEAVAQEASHALLRVMSRVARESGWEYGVSVRVGVPEVK